MENLDSLFYGAAKGPYDDDPDYVHDPALSYLENTYAAYGGEPPRSSVEFALYLDASDDLLNQFQTGVITADEFTELHTRMTDASLFPHEQQN